MDLSNVPSGINVDNRISGIIQNANSSRIATMTEYWYWDPDTGSTVVVGYDIELQKNNGIAWAGSTTDQSSAISISQDFVDNDKIPN